MLIVISILLVLMGIGILAFSHLDHAASGRTTRANLQLAQGFLDEYAAGPGMSKFGLSNDSRFASAFPYPAGYYGPKNSPTAIDFTDASAGAGGVVTSTSIDRNPMPRETVPGPPLKNSYFFPPTSATAKRNAVYNTAVVSMTLMQVPAVNRNVSNLPAQFMLTDDSGAPITLNYAGNSFPAPVMLDGWKNPIIFAPAGGIVVYLTLGGKVQDAKTALVRSSGIIYPFTGVLPPLRDNDHPFWASAGLDGDFSVGDDNVYSFQQ
jgi:type II secretory pathway pseudopilin PulG